METNTNPTGPLGDDTPTGQKYHQNLAEEGKPRLVSINEDADDIDPDKINDNSTGMGKDDYLGRTKDEE